MTTIQKLTLTNLKQNKKRTIVTILGVLLSAALICAVVGMALTGKESIVEWTRYDNGDFHALYTNVPAADVKYVTENAHVVRSTVFEQLGYAQAEDSGNDWKPYFAVYRIGADGFDDLAIHVTEGRLPETGNEILVSESVISNGNMPVKIGDTMTLDVGSRVNAEGRQLFQNDPFDVDAPTGESIVDTTPYTFTVVGLIERPSRIFETYEAPGYTLVSLLETPASAYRCAAVTFDSAKGFRTYMDQIGTSLNDADPEAPWDSTINKDLLEFEGALAANTLQALYALAAIILAIIVLTSVFVIRNSFAISVSEKTKLYGMLASIGSTSRQIRRSVLFEGLVIGAIGIPLGILLGIAAIVTLTWILNILLSGQITGMHFVYVLPPVVILLTIVLEALTIYLSCLIPSIRAGRIAPIEAIRGNQEIRIKARRLRTSALTKKLFGVGGVVASKNLKRSRSKYRTTVISLVVSITVFIALSSFLTLSRHTLSYYTSDYSYNLAINVSSEDDCHKIVDALDAADYTYYHYLNADYAMTYVSDAILEADPSFAQYAETVYGFILVMPSEAFARYAKKAGVDGDLTHAVILNDEMMLGQSNGGNRVVRFTNIQPGTTVPLAITNLEDDIVYDADLTVTAVTNVAPPGYERVYSYGGYMVIPETAVPENVVLPSHINGLYIMAEDADQMEQQFQAFRKGDPALSGLYVDNIHQRAEQDRRMMLAVEIFLYGFITVITLIGVTNIFNTISTNMMLRRKEFAMLRSVGMTDKQFHGMIRLENLLYSMKSLAIGIPLGLVGSILIYKAAAGEMDLGYQFPWFPILLSIVFVLLIVGLTMHYSMRKINEQNIIETIRSDNI